MSADIDTAGFLLNLVHRYQKQASYQFLVADCFHTAANILPNGSLNKLLKWRQYCTQCSVFLTLGENCDIIFKTSTTPKSVKFFRRQIERQERYRSKHGKSRISKREAALKRKLTTCNTSQLICKNCHHVMKLETGTTAKKLAHPLETLLATRMTHSTPVTTPALSVKKKRVKSKDAGLDLSGRSLQSSSVFTPTVKFSTPFASPLDMLKSQLSFSATKMSSGKSAKTGLSAFLESINKI